ncbi:unnamed protein product [Dracunculus medinensis]|uniref:PlsC domain-containing protein n=1 Tax=Dracunculus medinensis TaxID=318479 RepID=A0A0N4ULV0_DRAME|nr:unnamed protein product [Dracunculus medinensis]
MYSYTIIERVKTETIHEKLHNFDEHTGKRNIVKLVVDDSFDFVMAGIEAIIDDQITKSFRAEELASWNLLTRTSFTYTHINWKLTFLWIAGFLFRYFFLFPIRFVTFFVGFSLMALLTFIIGFIPNKRIKSFLNHHAMCMCMRILARSISAIIRFKNRENRAVKSGICVANHTSPTDVLILSCDNCYAMIGQRQEGMLGLMQQLLSRSADHIWFERTEANDRRKVIQRLQDHVDDPNKLPILIFPEGTCINNTSVMMFKKGSFEVVGSTIYPIAMKYDSRLGDAFWNSSEQSYGEYLFQMMTSWAITCDVWYLPAISRMDGESAIDFARRVKHTIAEKGGLVDLEWDGQLKRTKVPPKLIAEHQRLYWGYLSNLASFSGSSES